MGLVVVAASVHRQPRPRQIDALRNGYQLRSLPELERVVTSAVGRVSSLSTLDYEEIIMLPASAQLISMAPRG